MALSKVEVAKPAVVTLMPAIDSVEIVAGIDKQNMSHIIGRLTNLYGDTVIASVRETVSNATDASASIEPSKRRPVEITTPNLFGKSFSVRDYGVGMSREDVETVFSHYGSSTKGSDIDSIGSYGLGGKAPLAYTESFDVVTTKDGVTTSFTMSRSDGSTKTLIRSVVETGSVSGTEVTIPVKDYDGNRFENAVAYYKLQSHVTPIIVNGQIFHGNDDYFLAGEATLYSDPDETIVGKVFIRYDSLRTYFYTAGNRYEPERLAYSLSGWLYSADGNTTRDISPNIVVELTKSALLNFDSSRDSITNDQKLEGLNRAVMEALSSDEIIRKALSVLRAFDRATLAEITPKLDTVFNIYKEGETFSFGHSRSASAIYPIDLLKSDWGFNSFLIEDADAEPSVVLALSMSNDFVGILRRNANNKSGKLTRESSKNIGKISTYYSDSNLQATLAISKIAHLVYGSQADIFVVTEASEALFKSLLRERNALFAGARSKFIFAFSPVSKDKLNKEDVELATAIVGNDRIHFTSAVDLLKLIQPDVILGKKMRQLNLKTLQSQTLSLRHKFGKPRVADFSDVLETSRSYQVTTDYETFDHLFESEAILIVSKDWRSVFIGLLNAGHDLTNQEIAIYEGKLSVNEAKQLEAYSDRIYFSTEVESATKAVQKLAQGRIFHGTVLSSVLNAATFEQLMASAFGYSLYGVDQRSVKILADYIDQNDEVLMRTFKALIEIPSNKSGIDSVTANREILARFGDKYILAKDAIMHGIQKATASSYLIDSVAAKSVMMSPSKTELVMTPLIQEIFKYVAQSIAQESAAHKS